jgi:hypothetical protein
LLDRTAETTTERTGTPAPGEDKARPRRNPFAELPGRISRMYRESGLRGIAERGWQFFIAQSFSSLTRRIVSLNVAGLVALVVGTLYLSQFRAGLIEARVQSLVVQGEIIAGAIAASATSDACGGSSRRPRPARASMTATAFSFSTAATSTSPAKCCASTCRRRMKRSRTSSSAAGTP